MPPQESSPAPADLVPCPDCNEDGKMACPTCGGKGQLFKTCEVCKGSGQRPCPVCNKVEKVENAGPGRVPCDLCGGKGNLGDDKDCPRCLGGQTLQCDTCAGKGSLACRKAAPDKICPTCRAAGKVACTTCGGTHSVSPAVLLQRKARPSPPTVKAGEKAPGGTEKDPEEASPGATPRPTNSAGARGSDEPPPPSTAELDRRFEALREVYLGHRDLFAVDPRSKLELIQNESLKLARKLPKPERGDDSTATALFKLSSRVQSFRSRWGALHTLYLASERTFVPLVKLLDTRNNRLAETRSKGQREELEEELNRQVLVATGLAEAKSKKLADEKPQWVEAELAAVEKEWSTLKSRGETEVAENARKAEELAQKTAAEKKAAREARENKAREEKVRAGQAAQEKRQARSRPEATAGNGARSSGAGTAGTEPAALTQAPPRRTDLDSTSEPPQAAPTEGAGPMVWAIVGAAAAGAIFFLAGRLRQRTREAEST